MATCVNFFPVFSDNGEWKLVIVELVWSTRRKPYLGGYRHRMSGIEYHNASAQTHRPPIPDVSKKRQCRDSQVSIEFSLQKYSMYVCALSVLMVD